MSNDLKSTFSGFVLGLFSGKIGEVSEEHGERFRQDINEMERYQERWNVNMIADYCWMLKR